MEGKELQGSTAAPEVDNIHMPPGMSQEGYDQAREVFEKVTAPKSMDPFDLRIPGSRMDESGELETEDPLPEENTPEPDTDPGQEEPPQKTKTAAAEDRSVEDQSRYENAYRALRRAKVPKSVLDGLAEKDLLSWGADLLPVHDEVDRAFRDRDSLRDRLAELEKGATHESSGGADTAVPSSGMTLDASVVTPFVEAMGLSDSDGQEAVQQLANAIANQVGSSYEGKLSQMQQALLSMATHAARQDLGGSFPQVLEDDSAWEKVAAKAQTFMKTGDYDDNARGAWQDAASIVLGSPHQADPPSEEGTSEARKQRSRNQPTTRSRPAARRDISKDDEDRIFFEALVKTGDKDAAKRAVMRAKGEA